MINENNSKQKRQVLRLLSKKQSTLRELNSVTNLNSTNIACILLDLERKKLIKSFWKKEFNEKNGHTRITKTYLTNSQNFSKLKHWLENKH